MAGWKCPVRSAKGGEQLDRPQQGEPVSREKNPHRKRMMGISGVPSLLVQGEGQCHR
jgi:hypothetical protein